MPDGAEESKSQKGRFDMLCHGLRSSALWVSQFCRWEGGFGRGPEPHFWGRGVSLLETNRQTKTPHVGPHPLESLPASRLRRLRRPFGTARPRVRTTRELSLARTPLWRSGWKRKMPRLGAVSGVPRMCLSYGSRSQCFGACLAFLLFTSELKDGYWMMFHV